MFIMMMKESNELSLYAMNADQIPYQGMFAQTYKFA